MNQPQMNCRVCGLRLDEPPWGTDAKTPLFDFCPCCGVEFGYGDATVLGARRWREKWVHSGATWSEPGQRPETWVLDDQLRQIPSDFV
jgi:hypothetical protein